MSLPDVTPLFTPFQLRNLRLKSRFVMPPMQRGWVTNGVPQERYIPYFVERIRKGIGLVVVEATAIAHPSATWQPNTTRIIDEALPMWRRITDAVHEAGGHIFIQLWHEGALRKEGDGLNPDQPSLSASGIVQPGRMNGRAATLDELAAIKDAFVEGALFAKKAGFDGVELHGAHGYFLHSFLWSGTNVRDDRYGGATLAERAAYPAEVVSAIRAAVGQDYPITYRLSQWTEVDFSSRVAADRESLGSLVRTLEAAGVDGFHCSTRRFYEPEWDDSHLGLAGHVKKEASVPVIAVGSVGLDMDLFNAYTDKSREAKFGGVSNLAQLSKRFENNEFDLIAVGRSILADADWPTKISEGRYDEVRIFTKKEVIGDHEYDSGVIGEGYGVVTVDGR